MFGTPMSRGAFIVNLVLSGSAAYRTQIFLYLKACGREELSTANLWGGAIHSRRSPRNTSQPGLKTRTHGTKGGLKTALYVRPATHLPTRLPAHLP